MSIFFNQREIPRYMLPVNRFLFSLKHTFTGEKKSAVIPRPCRGTTNAEAFQQMMKEPNMKSKIIYSKNGQALYIVYPKP